MKILSYIQLYLILSITPLFAEKIVLASMAVGSEYQALVRGCYENKMNYCSKRGYGFRFERESWDENRPIPWSKILIILDIMKDPDVKWVFWSDADSLITNYHIRIKDLIDKRYDIITGSDVSGLNTGQFIIRNCEWSREFLERVYSRIEFTHHCWWEQAAVMDEYSKSDEVRRRLKILPQRVMNSYAPEFSDNIQVAWHERDFLIHFAGVRGNDLYYFMQKYQEKVIR